MASFYTEPRVVGSNGEFQYNDNGVLGASSSLTFDKTTGEVKVTGIPASLNTLLKGLAEAEAIRLRGTYTIGTPGTVPFGVGPITATGMDLAPVGAEHLNVIDIRSGSFC